MEDTWLLNKLFFFESMAKRVLYMLTAAVLIAILQITGKDYFLQNTEMSPTTSAVISPTRSKTYVAVLRLAGQQGSAMRSLSVLQCVLSSFYSHFFIVEPLLGTKVMGGYKENNGMKFSSIFDFDSFNVESRKMSYPEMVTMEEYTRLSPNHVIYVITSDKKDEVIWSAPNNGGKGTVRCYNKNKGGSNQNVTAMHKRVNTVKPHHCIVRVVQLHITRINVEHQSARVSPTNSIYNMVFGTWSPHDVSLVFNRYSAKFYIPVDKPLHGIHCMHSYANYEHKEQFKPSTRLLKDAKRYEESFLGGRNRLAIMLRVERVLKSYVKEIANPDKPKSLEQCFNDVLNASRNTLTGTNSLRPAVTLDIGKFGTKTFPNSLNESIIQLSKRTLLALYNNKWSFDEWEESFAQAANGETSGVYIAALQRILASRADCLILMGGGSFQALATHDYFLYHNTTSEKCLHLVCVMTEKNIEVQKTINTFVQPHST